MNKIDTTLMIEMCTYTLVRHKLADSNDDKLNLSISKTSYFKNHFSERSREQPLFVEKKSHLLEVLGSSYILYIYAVYNSMMTFCRLSSCVLN